MSESKICFRLAQATNTYKHISRNIGATMTTSKKLVHDNIFLIFSQKGIKNKLHYNQKSYSSKSLH